MADTEGRTERGGRPAASGGPAPTQGSPGGPSTEGHPEDVERSVKEGVEAEGIDVGSEDFDAITGASPHVGPTAGGG